MNESELLEQIMKKKDFSNLPKEDVKFALSKFGSKKYLDEERIKLTRDLLRKVYSGYASDKILSSKNKDAQWILRKHLSTRERLPYYDEVYSKILKGLPKKISVIDLGSGINGFSYSYFEKSGYDVDYLSVEAVGQFVELMKNYFAREKLGARAVHASLIDAEKIESEILKEKKPRVILLLKVIDCLEMLKRDYSKELLLKLAPLAERIVVSFATRSMIRKKKFFVNRKWITDFIEENFKVMDDFEIGGERYIVFSRKIS